jgi:hypothetical protein
VLIALGAWSQPALAAPLQQAATVEGNSATMTDPRLDPNGALGDARAYALATDPVTGPLRTESHLGPAGLELLAGSVTLSDFYTRATYVTPDNQPAGAWTIGIAFWAQNESRFYDFLIRVSSGPLTWSFDQRSVSGLQIIQQGDLGPGAVDLTPGALNSIAIVVAHGAAILSGNDLAVAATVDLGDAIGSGDVMTQAGFLADDPDTSNTLRFLISDFSVWDLPPMLSGNVTGAVQTPSTAQPTQTPVPPAAGEVASGSLKLQETFDRLRSAAMAEGPVASLPPGILQQQSSGIGFEPAGVTLMNVYVTATFTDPADLSTRSDCSLGFRDMDDDTEFRFVVASDGGWGWSIGTGAPIERGIVTNFDATPGASNTIEVIAQGAAGLLAIDGVVVQQVDLSANLNAGDVYFASGKYDTYTVDGRQVPYSGFAVYQCPA